MSKGFIVWPSEPNSAELPQQLAESTRIASDFHPGSLFPFSARSLFTVTGSATRVCSRASFTLSDCSSAPPPPQARSCPGWVPSPRVTLLGLRVPWHTGWGAGDRSGRAQLSANFASQGSQPCCGSSTAAFAPQNPLRALQRVLLARSGGRGALQGPDPRHGLLPAPSRTPGRFRGSFPVPPTVAQRFAAKHPDPPRRGGPGGPRLSRNRKPRKICKTVKSCRRTAAGARPPCAPLRRAEPRLPRHRAPLPSTAASAAPPAAPGTELRLPVAPSASFGAPSPGPAALPRAVPAPAALSSGHPRGAQPRSPNPVPVPAVPLATRSGSPARAEPSPGASRGTEPRFPRGPRARTSPPEGAALRSRRSSRVPVPTGTPRPGPPDGAGLRCPPCPAGLRCPPLPAPLPANFLRGGRCGARGGGGPHLASGRAAGAPGGRAPGAAPSRSAPAAHSRIDPRGLGRAEPSRCRCVCGSAPPRREPQTQRARAQRLRTRRLPRLLSPGGPGRAAGGGTGRCGAGRAPRDGRGWDGTGETLLPAQPGGPPPGAPFPPRRVPEWDASGAAGSAQTLRAPPGQPRPSVPPPDTPGAAPRMQTRMHRGQLLLSVQPLRTPGAASPCSPPNPAGQPPHCQGCSSTALTCSHYRAPAQLCTPSCSPHKQPRISPVQLRTPPVQPPPQY